MNSLKESVDYIYNYINDMDKEFWEALDKSAIYDMMQDNLIEVVNSVLSDDDIKIWTSNKNDTYLDKILNERLGENYPALLQEMTNDILNEYILSEWEEE